MPAELASSAEEGVAFGTVYIGAASNVLGLEGILECENHSQLLSRLVPLDTWLQTLDRMKPEFGRNLLIDHEDRRPKLMAIDFGMCFTDVLIPTLGPARPVAGSLPVVMHSGVGSLLDRDELRRTLDIIESTPDADVVKMVYTVPEAWLAAEGKGTLVSYLLRTRQMVRFAVASGTGLSL